MNEQLVHTRARSVHGRGRDGRGGGVGALEGARRQQDSRADAANVGSVKRDCIRRLNAYVTTLLKPVECERRARSRPSNATEEL